MKVAVAAIMLAFFAPAFADSMPGMDHKGMDMNMEKPAKTAAHKASGVVTKVDAAKSKVTIRHGAVQTLGWPAMTMTFAVKDAALLRKLAKGSEVDFQFEQQGKDYVITSVN